MSLRAATHAWQAEVEREAERLIGEGIPPWDAAVQARNNVSERRRRAAERKGLADAAVVTASSRRLR